MKNLNRFAVRSALSLAALALASTSSFAQSFNIDVGPTGTTPNSTFAAAAAQPGVWNNVSAGTASAPLVDLLGNSTGVTLSHPAGFDFSFDNAGTTGNDQALLDDLQDIGYGSGAVTTWTFSGLASGPYVVYTYSWAPDNRTGFFTNVSVTGSSDPTQLCGGALFSGSYVQGSHYAKHNVVSAGTITVSFQAGPTSFGNLNGFQIVGAPPCPPISAYCTAKISSNGCVPQIGSTGTPDANSGSGFVISATYTINNKNNILFYGTTGTANVAFQGGLRCVAGPLKRTPVVNSGGNAPPNDCSGNPSMDFNTRIASGVDPALVAGAQVWAQWYGRDPGYPEPYNVTLSNALTFTICDN